MTSDRWRYLVVEARASSPWRSAVDAANTQVEPDRHGAQGWEAVSALPRSLPVGIRLLFERPN